MKIKNRIFSLIIATVIPLSMAQTFSSAKEIENVEKSIENKISLEVKDMMDKGEKEIPVYIWYNDIDQVSVENEVCRRTGLSLSNMELDYTSPTSELIQSLSEASIGNIDENLENLLDQHLEENSIAREIELNRTNTYTSTRRDVSREKYSEKSKIITNEMNIIESKIEFRSQYAPMIIATLTPEQISKAKNNSNIDSIDIYSELKFEDELINGNFLDTMGVNSIVSKIPSLTGDGVRIGIFEGSSLSQVYAEQYGINFENVEILSPVNATGDHSSFVAGIAAGRYGVAPDATIVSASTINKTYANLESLISSGVSVINLSFGYCRNPNSSGVTNWYTNEEKWYDHISAQHNILVIKSAGNSIYGSCTNYNITSPGMAYNLVTVNSFTDNTKEVLCDFSYVNGDDDGCAKPDVIAVGGAGTSAAAPTITGMIALLYQYKPSLKLYPHASKAILSASCHRKAYDIDGNTMKETMFSGLTDKQGAGIPSIYNMISIAAQHNYGFGKINGTDSSRDDYKVDKINILQPKYGASNINVSLSYLRESTISGGHDSTSGVDVDTSYQDLDIRVFNGTGNGTLIGASSKYNSSTEMVYASLSDTSNNYRFEIRKYDYVQYNPRYAYAWSTDNTRYRNDEPIKTNNHTVVGTYYIKNKNSNKYLTVNEGTNNLTQATFNGGNPQQWIVTLGSNGKYQIKTVTGKGNIISSNSYNTIASVNTSTDYIAFEFDLDAVHNDFDFNTFEISSISNPSLSLGIKSNSTFNSAEVWWVDTASSTSDDWYLEKIAYQKGDINIDGVVDSQDLQMFNQYLLGSTTLNVLQAYLADTNLDGYLNLFDRSLIQKYILEG